MNIISVGNFAGLGWDGSWTDENHIADSLEGLGYEVTRFQREETKEAYWKLPNADFALIQQWDGYADDLVARLRMFTKVIVFAAFDYQEWNQPWCEKLIEQSDLYLSKRIADSKYKNWSWWCQDFAPQFLDKAPRVEKDIDVLFTGSYLPWATERNETLKAVDDKFNLVIHSVNEWPGFRDVRPPIMDDGLPGLYARAKVVLSIDHTIEAGYWSDRVAQILCCGGLVLHRYQPMCEIPFKNKVAYFGDVDECLFQIDRLLEMPEEDADLCRRVGYEYADEFLRVNNRVEDLLTIVRGIL